MGEWMNAFISRHSALPSLEKFAQTLRDHLQKERLDTQGHLIHLAGYGLSPVPGTEPEFWFIRNYSAMDEETGGYAGQSGQYEVSEDFRTRDVSAVGGWTSFRSRSMEQIYVNGPARGRSAFNMAMGSLAEVERHVIDASSGKIRAPKDAGEMAERIIRRFEFVSDLYSRNTTEARGIGGPTQICVLPQP